MTHRSTLIVLPVLLALAGCPGTEDFRCGPESRCPNDQVCNADGQCVASDGGTVADLFVANDGLATDDLAPCQPLDLKFSGDPVQIDVPENARFMHVKAWGAGGNSDCSGGGAGGYTEAVYTLSGVSVLTGVVGRLGRNDGVVAFGFAAKGGGGLTGIFSGAPPLADTESDRAIVIAGGGGSSIRDECADSTRGGSGNQASAGGMPTMRGGEATYIGPTDRNINTGGGGGYEGGLGRDSATTAGKGGTAYVASAAPGLAIQVEAGVEQKLIEAFDDAQAGVPEPPHSDDPDYLANSADCEPGSSECHGLLIVRFLCGKPAPIVN